MGNERKAAGPLIGAHMSISGGVDKAPLRGRDVGCVCMQIFTKSNMQWASRPLGEQEIADFRKNCAETGIGPVMAHDSYLINLASADSALAKKSLESFVEELQRCEALGLPALIMHPGSHADEAEGLKRIAGAIDESLERTKGSKVKVLVEATAGAGTNLGSRFEHLAQIISGVRQKARMGACLDTCHMFAAGYDIRTEDGYQKTMQEFDKVVGLKRLGAFHFNDAKGELGRHLDRHEHIGHGKLGKEPFRLILQDERLDGVPKILETPKGMKGDQDWDAVSLKLLRGLAGRP